jgi:hypothetical protein
MEVVHERERIETRCGCSDFVKKESVGKIVFGLGI